ncbi:MAG: hypothetical protein LW816_03055 [Planctomyces sp.]|jgi:hypothetical protein|nr:hypothetical protein [Planctomyces sp.]
MKHSSDLPAMLQPFHRRRKLLHAWHAAADTLWQTGCVLSVASVSAPLLGISLPIISTPLLACGSAAVAAVRTVLTSANLDHTARWLDRELQLKDRLSSALQFLQIENPSPMQQLQIADARNCLASVSTDQLLPLRTPANWKRGLAITAFGTLLAIVGPAAWPHASDTASPAATAVRESQRMQAELQSLEEVARQTADPDLQQALESMNRTLQDLQSQPLPPEEAFAKLADMENSLQQLQQKLNNPAALQQLQSIGEAMSATDELEDVGNMLSNGKLEQAAAALAKTQNPRLDRSERRTVSEKLQQVQQQFQQSAKPQGSQKIAEAAGKMAEGLQHGDSQKFEEAAQGMAAEARRLAGQKKLSDLLQQQMQSLAQARSEFESEAGNQAQGQGKGGNKAGKGTAGDPQGQQNARNAAGSELKLTGDDSGTGDSETEKSEGQPQDQQAERQYRQNAQRYEALSEAALRSEPIPPGQKSLIRRYFQLIRPAQQPTENATAPQ